MNGNFRRHEWKFTTSTLQMNGNFRRNKWKFPSPTHEINNRKEIVNMQGLPICPQIW